MLSIISAICSHNGNIHNHLAYPTIGGRAARRATTSTTTRSRTHVNSKQTSASARIIIISFTHSRHNVRAIFCIHAASVCDYATSLSTRLKSAALAATEQYNVSMVCARESFLFPHSLARSTFLCDAGSHAFTFHIVISLSHRGFAFVRTP